MLTARIQKTCHACPRKDSRISKLVQDNDGLLMANEYLRSKINTLEQKEDYHVETLEKLRVNHEVLDNQVKSLIDAKGNFPDAKIPELENQSLRTKASVIERRGATDIATLADMEKQITSLEVASERKDVDHMAAEEKIRHLELHKHELEVQIHQMKDYTRTSGSNVSLGSEDKAMYEAQIKSLNEKLESFRHEAKMRLEYVEMGQRLMRDLFSRD